MTRYAFNHMPALKAERLQRQKAHVERGLLKTGKEEVFRFEPDRHERFCSIGCDYADITGQRCEADWPAHEMHETIARHDGLPIWIEHIREIVFEGLDNTIHPERISPARWHVAMTESIPVGANMDQRFFLLCHCFVLWRIRSLKLSPWHHAALKLVAEVLVENRVYGISESFLEGTRLSIAENLAMGARGSDPNIHAHVAFLADVMLRIEPEDTGHYLAQIIDISFSYPDADIPVSVYPDIARNRSRSPLTMSGELRWKPTPHRSALYHDFAQLVLMIMRDGSAPKQLNPDKVAA